MTIIEIIFLLLCIVLISAIFYFSGKEKGYNKGYNDGQIKDIGKGWRKGFEKGKQAGIEEGFKDGQHYATVRGYNEEVLKEMGILHKDYKS